MTKASWGEKGVYLPYKLELIVEGSQDGNSNSKPQIGSKTESMKEHHLVDYSATFLIQYKISLRTTLFHHLEIQREVPGHSTGQSDEINPKLRFPLPKCVK